MDGALVKQAGSYVLQEYIKTVFVIPNDFQWLKTNT